MIINFTNPHTTNGVCYVYGSRNEFEIFRAVSDTNFANVAPVFVDTRFFGAEILIAATHSPLELIIGAATH
jgi:hypothetical protein